MRKTIICLAAFLLLLATSAVADTIDYTVTDPLGTLTFSLDSNSSPCFVDSGAFALCSVPTSDGTQDIYFYGNYDGFLSGLGFSLSGYEVTGPQLYTGSEFSPTLLTGTFQAFLEGSKNSPATIVATDVTTPVPEPGSMLLLGTGLVGALGAFRRRLLGK